MKLLQFLKLKPPQPTIDSYGEPTGVSPEQVQSVMEWLFASLLNAGYEGRWSFLVHRPGVVRQAAKGIVSYLV